MDNRTKLQSIYDQSGLPAARIHYTRQFSGCHWYGYEIKPVLKGTVPSILLGSNFEKAKKTLNTYIKAQSKPVTVHLNADKNLSPKTANALAEMVTSALRAINKGTLPVKKIEDSVPAKVTREEVLHERYIVHEFLAYLRQLALEDPDMPMTTGQVWKMFEEGLRVGKMWWVIAEEMNLPAPDTFNW